MLAPFSLQGQDLQPPPPAGLQTATFAGGCFWCMVHPFEVIDGVISTISGYTGGSVANPTYEQVSAGSTGHKESVEIVFDPKKVSYQTLLDVYWRNIDPFDDKGQFCDKGIQYSSAIFAASDEQKALAEASKRKIEERFGRPIATDILPVAAVFDALAIPITYRPRLGEPTVVRAVQVRPPTALDALGGGRVAHDGLIVQIRAVDLSHPPAEGDQAIIDQRRYRVRSARWADTARLVWEIEAVPA